MWDRDARVCTVESIHKRNLSASRVQYGSISIVTYNICNDRSKSMPFRDRSAGLEERLRLLIIEHDFVLLQEVPESFLPSLSRAAKELNVELATTADTEDITDHLAVFTRHTISDAKTVKLNRMKAFLVVDVLTEDMRVLRVLNVHLTSAMQSDSASKRAEQLQEIAKHTSGHHAVIAGQ
jgi:hypothetical protein